MEQRKPPDQLIYEARCRALGIEPKPFGPLDLEKINQERRIMEEAEKFARGEKGGATYGGTRMGGH